MPNALTREVVMDIISLHKDGLTNRKIAKALSVNHKTVSSYLTRNGLKPNGTVKRSTNFITKDIAVCSKCFQERYIEEFIINRRGKLDEYRLSYCNRCRRDQILLSINSDWRKILKDIFNRTKNRCRKNNIDFNLTFEYLKNIFHRQNSLCFYSERPFVLLRGIGYNPDACTIDRVCCNAGYTKGNVVLSSKRLNTIKSNLTLEEMRLYTPLFFNKIKSTEWIDCENLKID